MATLAEKLQLKGNPTMTALNAPVGYLETLAGDLPGVTLLTEAGEPADAALLFVNSLEDARRLAPDAIKAVRRDGLLWVAYPKGTSKVKTDVNRDKLWPVLEAIGWRPVRQIAIDEVWSALRFRPAELVGR